MAILNTLSLAGSGVALDSRAARTLAGITFVFRADRALAIATLQFCSSCSLADLTRVCPCRCKTHQESSSNTCLGMGTWQLPCPTRSIDSPERKQLAAVRL